MKNKLKKYSLYIIVFMFSFFLFGCSANYSVTLSENGLIDVKLSLNLASIEQKLSEQNKKVVKEVNSAIIIYFNQLDKAFEENIVSFYSNIYNFEALGLSDNTSKTKHILINQRKFIVGDSEVEATESTLKLNKTFVSIYAYLMYFYPSAFEYNKESNSVVISDSYNSLIDIPLSSSGTEVEQTLFINKYIQTCTPFYYNGEEPKFLYDYPLENVAKGTTLKQFLQNKTGLSENDLKVVFNFSTPYHRLHSNGTINKTQSGYTHSWVLGSVDSEVVFYRNYANYVSWYVVAIIAGLLVLGVGILVGNLINKHKKKVGLTALKNIDNFVNQNNKKKN